MAAPLHFTLANGLRVSLLPLPAASSVAMSVLVRVGSVDDPAMSSGLSHLLEHMLFRGSKRYRSTHELLLPFELGGGSLEAETWRDHTHFGAEVAPAAAPAALLALGDMLAHPRLVGLRAEKQLVAAEVALDLDEDGEEADLHALTRQAVWPEQKLARRITGTLASVAAMSRAQLVAHHRQYYGARNAVLSVAGPMDAKAMQQAVIAAFAGLAPGEPAKPQPQVLFRPQQAVTEAPGSAVQVALQLSFAASPLSSPEYPLYEAAAGILGEGMLSRLQVALSEETGLVYAFDAGLDVYESAATYDIELTVSSARASRALAALLRVLEQFAEVGPTARELLCLSARRCLDRARTAARPGEAAYQHGLELMFQQVSAKALPLGVDAHAIRSAARQLLLAAPRHLFISGSPGARIQAELAAQWRDYGARCLTRDQAVGLDKATSTDASALPAFSRRRARAART